MTPSFKTAADFAASTAADFAKAIEPSGCCAVAGCGKPLGANGIVCADDYFRMDRNDLRLITRLQLQCRRCDDPDERRYLREQLEGYATGAVRRIEAKLAVRSSSA